MAQVPGLSQSDFCDSDSLVWLRPLPPKGARCFLYLSWNLLCDFGYATHPLYSLAMEFVLAPMDVKTLMQDWWIYCCNTELFHGSCFRFPLCWQPTYKSTWRRPSCPPQQYSTPESYPQGCPGKDTCKHLHLQNMCASVTVHKCNMEARYRYCY